MVRLLLRGAAIAFAASACWSCGTAPNSTQPGPGGDSGATGDSSPDASADTGPADNDAEVGLDARDGAIADALAEVDVASAAFTLTSSAFADKGGISAVFDCGSDVSPPLAWTPGPAGTQSYGVVLTDAQGLYYWVLWDIPATTTSLPQGVDHAAMPATPAGSEQIASGLDGSTWSRVRGPLPAGPEYAVYLCRLCVERGDLAGGHDVIDGRRRFRGHAGQHPRKREADRPGDALPFVTRYLGVDPWLAVA